LSKSFQYFLSLLIVYFFSLFYKEEFMKIISKVLALMAVIAFVGCAATAGRSGGSAGGNKSKLSEADLQKIGITHGGYGNSN
jgi:hypothetical protein